MLIVLLVTWHQALHLMHHGLWCTAAGHLFACTPFPPPGRLLHLLVPFGEMRHLVRHGWECTASGHRFVCTPRTGPLR